MNLSMPERFAWAVPYDGRPMWRLVPDGLPTNEGSTQIDRWQTRDFHVGRYVWWEILVDGVEGVRNGWRTAIVAVVNDRQDRPETMQPPNMHCEEFRGHFVVYKRHYRDDDECGLEEDLYVPMSREEVVVAIDTYKKRMREREIETQQTLARLGK
jgi:hypothetical protein